MWSESDKEILRKYFPTESKESLSAMLHRSFDTIRHKAQEMGIRRIYRWMPEEIEALRKLYPHGSREELTKVIHRPFRSIESKAERMGIHRPTTWCKQKLEGRFENFVMPEPNSGCRLWMGGTERYGHIRDANGEMASAHRVSWEIYNGPVPKGLYVLHKCNCQSCVNPMHLYCGTAQDNTQDMIKQKRHSFGEHRPLAKLTDTKVMAIRTDPRSGKEIASIFGVSANTISCIKRRKTWKHI